MLGYWREAGTARKGVVMRVNKDAFTSAVSKRSGYTKEIVNNVCDAAIEETKDIVERGDTLSITGFGSFAVQKHKGHPVQFGDSSLTVRPYSVFRFSPSHVFSRRLRDALDKD